MVNDILNRGIGNDPAKKAVARPNFFIPVYQPEIGALEKAYVNECLDTSWISSLGKYVERFETEIARVSGVPHGVAVSNGTVALHLAHHCLNLQPGDEVLVPTFTYIASVNTITQCGARPVFVESRADDWLMDVEDARSKITKRTKGIVPVHLFGAVSDMDAIMALAKEHDLYVLEDCAEALGSTRGGRPAGSFGDASSFSFFGNKTVTTGEGGMVVAREEKLATHMRLTKGQGQDPNRRYWHDRMGFNYRMTNIAAAIGCAQMERFEDTLTRKAEIARLYKDYLSDAPVQFQQLPDDVVSSNWLVSLLLPAGLDREVLMETLKSAGVDSRPVFYCSHHLPMYADNTDVSSSFPIAEDIAARGISLPSYPSMTNEMVEWVCTALIAAIENLQSPTIE
jgi:perosamine synthetase